MFWPQNEIWAIVTPILMASIWLSGALFYYLGLGEQRGGGGMSEVGDLTAYASSCAAVPITTSLVSPHFSSIPICLFCNPNLCPIHP